MKIDSLAQGVKLERPNIRVIPKNRFETLASISDLVLKLFGPLQKVSTEV
jgi:hypothetical protein